MNTLTDARRQRLVRPASALSVPVAAVVVGWLVSTAVRPLLMLVLLAAVFLALMTIPRKYLGATALLAWALIPVKFLSFVGEPATLNPALLVVLIWAARRVHEADERTPERPATATTTLVVSGTLSAWVMLCTLTSMRPFFSIGWSFDFLALVILPVLLLRADREALAPIAHAWAFLGVVLGVYAMVEAWVLKSNPLLDWAYHSAEFPIDQVWGVYRATTTLGHPLTNGLFFAVTACMIFARWLSDRRRWLLLSWVCALGGLGATASRSAALAFGIGIIVTMATALPANGTSRRAVLALAILGLPLVYVGSNYLGERSASVESTSSFSYRKSLPEITSELAHQRPVVGFGPGLADVVKRERIHDQTKSGIEDSWLQLIVSTGVLGAGLMAALMGLVGLRSLKSPSRSGLGALVALATAIAGFNFLEADRPALLIVGLVIGVVSASADVAPKAPQAEGDSAWLS